MLAHPRPGVNRSPWSGVRFFAVRLSKSRRGLAGVSFHYRRRRRRFL